MPYNSPMKKKGSSCVQMKDHKGKPSGLMMEGSVAYQEETKKVEEAKAKKLDKKQEIKETKDLLTEMPIDNKSSALEMGHESPVKMSPLNDNHDIDPKTGKKITYRLKGTSNMYDDEGFLKPEFAMDEGGAGEEGANTFFDRQRRADGALNIAQNLLTGGASANLGHISTDYPHAAGLIVGQTMTDDGRYLDTSVEPAQANIDRLREINRSDPERAFNEISARTRGATLGDAHDDWKMEVDPLNQFDRMRSGWRNKKRKSLGDPGQTLNEKIMANKNRG